MKKQLIRIDYGERFFLLDINQVAYFNFREWSQIQHSRDENDSHKINRNFTTAINIWFAGVSEITGHGQRFEGDVAINLWCYLQQQRTTGGQTEHFIEIDDEYDNKKSILLINPEQITICEFRPNNQSSLNPDFCIAFFGEDQVHSFGLTLSKERGAQVWSHLNTQSVTVI